jgi:hypothetical protein
LVESFSGRFAVQLVTDGIEGSRGLAMTYLFYGTVGGLVFTSLVCNLSANLNRVNREI